MKNQLNSEDQFLNELFQQSATTPKGSLKEEIMRSIEARPAFEYEPVISKKAWRVIYSVFLSTIGYLLFAYKGEGGKPYFDLDIPTLDFSALSEWSTKMTNAFNGFSLQLPEVSSILVASLGVILLTGVAFVVSYKNKVMHNLH
ncbi:hypothetical protein [Marinoscillum sp.]|uniref:hypothetical protein n=1 Tax=Marinoscillum sp. TaxID=2024838 RepID=UPI003BAD6719